MTTLEFQRRRGNPYRVAYLDRADFLNHYWNYKVGEHATFLGSTGCGKTQLIYQLLERTERATLPSYFLAVKKTDETVSTWHKKLHHRLVREWPPPPHQRLFKPAGWTVWPKHTIDFDDDTERHAATFRNLIRSRYMKGHCIVVADEAGTLGIDHKLAKDQKVVLKNGRSGGLGFWSADQRPAFLVQEAYNGATHLFLPNEVDERNRKRFDEIGGFDTGIIRDITWQLPEWHYLYLHRKTRTMAVIGP